MHALYRGRSHTKKQNNCKRKITAAERKVRTARKKLEQLFPGLKFTGLGSRFQSIYQHSISSNQKKNAV